MYNKFFKKRNVSPYVSKEGGVSGEALVFFSSLKREIKIWKMAVFLILAGIVVFGIKDYGEIDHSAPITTKQIRHLKKDVIAQITIEGPIIEDRERERLLEEVLKSSKIKGILVIINTPGGSPNASEIIYAKLKEMGKKIPVYSFVKEIGASGGYMAAIGTQRIFAMPTSLIGSIGVISGGRFDVSEVLKKYNIGYENYASSEYKGVGNVYKKITKAENEYRETLVMELFRVFKDMVSKERNLKGEKLERVANAKVFYAEKALEYGLIDEIGTSEDAINHMKKNVVSLKDLHTQEINQEPKKPENMFANLLYTVKDSISLFYTSKILAITKF